MRYRHALAVVTVPVCFGLCLAAGPTFAGPTFAGSARTHSTSFAMHTSGYGTRMIGGQVPAGSSTTGYQVIGCTNRAGRSHSNYVAEVTIPGLGTASGVKTRVWTTKHNGVVASHSRHSIAQLVLAQSQLGSLAIDAITSQAKAYHDGTGFHAVTSTQVGGITLTPPVGPAQTFPAPTPDQPIAIPGLATIYAGKHVTRTSSTGAFANAYALRIEVAATGGTVSVARSQSRIDAGLLTGIFNGHSDATRVVTAAGDIAKSGPNPLTVMPCQGTYGHTRQKSLASSDLGGQLVVNGANSMERGDQTARRAHGVSRAEIAQLNLGGQLQIDGIVARAQVVRDQHGVHKSARGTRLGSVTVNGQQQTFPPSGVLEIPGLAKLERHVVTRTHSGISVIGLRITLLDGSGAVINLAEAKLRIAGLH